MLSTHFNADAPYRKVGKVSNALHSRNKVIVILRLLKSKSLDSEILPCAPSLQESVYLKDSNLNKEMKSIDCTNTGASNEKRQILE